MRVRTVAQPHYQMSVSILVPAECGFSLLFIHSKCMLRSSLSLVSIDISPTVSARFRVVLGANGKGKCLVNLLTTG